MKKKESTPKRKNSRDHRDRQKRQYEATNAARARQEDRCLLLSFVLFMLLLMITLLFFVSLFSKSRNNVNITSSKNYVAGTGSNAGAKTCPGGIPANDDGTCPNIPGMPYNIDDPGQTNGNGADLLLPKDLPPIRLYSDWRNHTMVVTSMNGEKTTELKVATGQIKQAGYIHIQDDNLRYPETNFLSEFSTLINVVTRDEVAAIMKLLRDPILLSEMDYDPDTVDGFATQEIFLDNMELRAGRPAKTFETEEQHKKRRLLRMAFNTIVQPIIEDRITPFVNEQYSKACKQHGRQCHPCYSFVRRYLEGERQTHPPHRDGQSLVSVAISLSDYGTSYRGGLSVASEFGQPYYLGLNKGDAAVHQSDLLHGVQVRNGDKVNAVGKKAEHWSWVLWYRDSESCEDHSHEWFQDCAHQGNPTCEMLHSTKVGNNKDWSKEEQTNLVVDWNIRAADHGHPTACVKLARAYLGNLPSSLDRDENKARHLYQRAIQTSNDPDAHYGLATMLITEGHIDDAINHLKKSAMGEHPFAMFNVGMMYLFGYGNATVINRTLAAEWFEASLLPEGLAARAQYYHSMGEADLSKEYQRRAIMLGFGTPWRVMARMRTGYGGASGVDLNLPWPPNRMNQLPPKW